MKFLRVIILIIICASYRALAYTPETNPNQTKHFIAIKGSDTAKLGFLICLPEGYNKQSSPMPLIVFLHGAGEKGSDPDDLRAHGLPLLLERGKDIPFVVVSPLCPVKQPWNFDVLDNLLDSVRKDYNVDTTRIYLTGISSGGTGVLSWAIKEPGKFAAIAPLCGFADTVKVKILKSLPIWIFHGEKDMVAPVAQSETIARVIAAAGGNPRFTKYPELAHSIWRETYNNPQLYEWFLSNKAK